MNTRRDLIFPVYIPTLIMSFSQGMLIPTLPIFAKEFVTSYGMIGLVLAAEGTGRILGDIPAGLLLRKFGRNLSMILGILLVVTSVALLYTASTTTQIVFLRLLSGIGNATWNVSRHAYLAGATAPHERGRAPLGEVSQDPGSGKKGGSLGSFSPGQMVPEFDTAAFSGEVGVVQGPVKTQFGYHLLEVTQRTE